MILLKIFIADSPAKRQRSGKLGTIKVDFSAITDASGLIGNGISVLKVPSAQIPSNVTWEPINAPISKLYARWVNGSDGYSTLKIRQNSALFIRIR